MENNNSCSIPLYWVGSDSRILDPDKGIGTLLKAKSNEFHQQQSGNQYPIHSLKLTVRTWKRMVGILSFRDGLFQGQTVGLECSPSFGGEVYSYTP